MQGFRAFYLWSLLRHHWIKNYIRKGLFLCIKPLIWHSILLKSEKSPRFSCFRQLKLLFSRSKISFGSTWFEISLSVCSIVLFYILLNKSNLCRKNSFSNRQKILQQHISATSLQPKIVHELYILLELLLYSPQVPTWVNLISRDKRTLSTVYSALFVNMLHIWWFHKTHNWEGLFSIINFRLLTITDWNATDKMQSVLRKIWLWTNCCENEKEF